MTTAKLQARPALQDTRVTSEPLAELPQVPSRRPYGPGDVIDDRYELEALLGTGGMGEVWIARNDTLGVRRALKLIRADSGGAENTDRLLTEARAAARLSDPAIVRVFDFGKTAWGDPFIVMEMLEGENLMSIINRRERLSPTKAVRVLLPVIRALGTAHEHGIVHRDLKPENIFLAKAPDGRVQPKLLDFGIAKLKNAHELRLTHAGSIIGSPLYMAPEQARGEDVDERADIWALSVVLYEAITGSLPFEGDDRAAVMYAVTSLEPKELARHGVSDGGLWPIIKRGLGKGRDERFPSMVELGRALARWLLDGGINDDITGASLEAGWFRNAHQSLFASSLPPKDPFASARRRLSRARAQLAALAVLVACRAEDGIALWRRLDRNRRLLVFAGTALGLGASVSLGMALEGSDEPRASTDATAPVEAAGGAPGPISAEAPEAAAAPGTSSAADTSASSEQAPAPARDTVTTSAAPSSGPVPIPSSRAAVAREPESASRARAATPTSPVRKPRRKARPKNLEGGAGDRRSKLIDPYQ